MFEYEINPEGVAEADVVVGIASYKEADSIGHPTRQADLGLRKYFGDRKGVIINCDNHSPDDTKGAFLCTETETPKIYITTPPETPGKGWNFENLFRKSRQLGAKAIVCVDADLISINPEWIRYFGEPILDGYDYVTPVYSRHKYDGTITNNLRFPLVYGLLCRNIRQPIGGDFALSTRFADHVLLQPWHRTTRQYGIDIFLSMNALLGDFRVCQAGLGSKVHKPSAPKLGPMFLQVVGTAFLTILRNASNWRDLSEIESTEVFGKKDLEKEQELDVDRGAVRKNAVDGWAENRAEAKKHLRPETFAEIEAAFAGGEPEISTDLWVRGLYEMLAATTRADDAVALLESLRPLYFGRTYTFMNETWDMPTPEAETRVLAQAKRFHEMRGYLLELLG